MKKFLAILLLCFVSFSVFGASLTNESTETAPEEGDTLIYYNFKPCSHWKYVSDFDAGIYGYVCDWAPYSDANVPDAHSLLAIINKMEKRMKQMEDRLHSLEKQLGTTTTP